MSYNTMWMFIFCGLRDLVPLVGSLLVLVPVRVYTGGPSAVVSFLGYFLVVWFVGSLCGTVSGPLYEVRWLSKNVSLFTSIFINTKFII
jgi:hypothetical protein